MPCVTGRTGPDDGDNDNDNNINGTNPRESNSSSMALGAIRWRRLTARVSDASGQWLTGLPTAAAAVCT